MPSVRYVKLWQDPTACVDLHEHFIKQTLRNRFSLLTANGVQWITLPLQSTGGEKRATADVHLATGNWNRPIKMALQSAYGKSAFYSILGDDLNHWLDSIPGQSFQQAMASSHELIARCLKIQPPTLTHSYIDVNPNHQDLRDNFKQRGQGVTPYPQVFMDRFEFESDLCIWDLLFNTGPEASHWISDHA